MLVYTAISSGYDPLPPAAAIPSIRWVAFAGEELAQQGTGSPWQIRPLCDRFEDGNRNAKFHKVLSHLEFPEEELTVWIDGSIRLPDPQRLLELPDRLGDGDLAVFEHRSRTCVYQEAATCLAQRLDDPALIWRAACELTRAGVPPDAGLWECSLLVRRRSDAVQRFNECWWRRIEAGSRRDQLSFDSAVLESGARRVTLPGTIDRNPWAIRVPHHSPHGRSVGRSRRRITSGPPSTSLRTRRRTIALGPIRPHASWSWAGFDIGRQLSKFYEIELFESMGEPPRADVVLVVKRSPSAEFVRNSEGPVVFCPVDRYGSEAEIEADEEMLRHCRAILCHSPSLRPYLEGFTALFEVEHHLRFALPPGARRPEDFVLWLGGFEHVPHLLRWLRDHPIDAPLQILTDYRNERAIEAARDVSSRLPGAPIDVIPDASPPASLGPWRLRKFSERRQAELLASCRAAIDIKGSDFAQRTKPPTKVQQFIASGIPTAVNPWSTPACWFEARGFSVASPLDVDRWFSDEYRRETEAVASRLQRELSLESIVARYCSILEDL